MLSARAIRNRPRLALVAVLSMAIVIAGVASRASAYEQGSYTADGVNIRSGPYLSGTSVYGLGYEVHQTCMYFSAEGDTPPGWAWSTWTYHRNMNTSVEGWSYNGYLVFYPQLSC